MFISVIIPTRNRVKSLQALLESLLLQTYNKDLFEILVIDNGSTDETVEVVNQSVTRREGPRIEYFFAPEPGLHVGRHLGAKRAHGDILVFADDDILATPGWLTDIHNAFHDPDVALVGGKILPQWEGECPEWLSLFRAETEWGWTIGYLSLLDFGDTAKEIPGIFVYGCNFSIRKTVLYECGGFHPDSMPQELIRYRGDGETALAQTIQARGYKIRYAPQAAVYHRVPPERLTVEYFCRRAFNQGVSDSYTEIRRQRQPIRPEQRFFRSLVTRLKLLKQQVKNSLFPPPDASTQLSCVVEQVGKAYQQGKEFHRRKVEHDQELLRYILQHDYYSVSEISMHRSEGQPCQGLKPWQGSV